jgi:drug/metabolite transporter (DMT)-like permease
MRNGWSIALVVIGVLGLWLTLTSPTHSTLDRWHAAAWSLLFAVALGAGIYYSVRAGRMASRQIARPTRTSNGWALGLVLLGLSATYIALTTPATPDGASRARVILLAALGIWAVVQGMWFLTRGRAG